MRKVGVTFRPATNWRLNCHLGTQVYLAMLAQ
jgi:hypothetical protein